jgi:hypothetical protein
MLTPRVVTATAAGAFLGIGYEYGGTLPWVIGGVLALAWLLSLIPLIRRWTSPQPQQPRGGFPAPKRDFYPVDDRQSQAGATQGDFVEGSWTYDQPTAAPQPRHSAPRHAPAPAAEEGPWHLYYRKMDARGSAKGERHEVLDSEQLCYDRLQLYGSNEIGYARPFYLHSARIVSPGGKTTTINVANYPRPR